MKLPVVLAVLTGITLLVAAIGCSTTPPAEVAPTPDIEATVEARLAQERAVDATIEARAKELVAAQPTPTPNPTYTPIPTATPPPQPTNTAVPQPTNAPEPAPMNTPTFVPTATSLPTPTPRPLPTATPAPTPTAMPAPTPIRGNRLSINGTLVGPGQIVVPVPYGTVMVYPSPREGGQFEVGQEVILGAYPLGVQANWYGVDTSEQTQATLTLTKTRYVVVEIILGALGQPYIAEDGVEVTLTSLNTTVVGNVTSVTISYGLRNTTEDLKDEESWKLCYSDGGGLPQYGFFGQMPPGQTINRSYTFNVQSPDVPSVVAYPSRFFGETWQQSDLIWDID